MAKTVPDRRILRTDIRPFWENVFLIPLHWLFLCFTLRSSGRSLICSKPFLRQKTLLKSPVLSPDSASSWDVYQKMTGLPHQRIGTSPIRLYDLSGTSFLRRPAWVVVLEDLRRQLFWRGASQENIPRQRGLYTLLQIRPLAAGLDCLSDKIIHSRA